MSCGCGSCLFLEYSPGRSVATDSTEMDHEPYTSRDGDFIIPGVNAPAPLPDAGWLAPVLADVERQSAALNAAFAPPAHEATGEMSDSVVAALVGMIAPQRGEDADDRYSRERAIKELLDGIAALRSSREAERQRADRAEERAEKTTEHLLNSVAKAVRRGDELERERDEAREQLAKEREDNDVRRRELITALQIENEKYAAANARAEEAEQGARLAEAHDRQPYPTAWAYEQACKALEKHRADAETERAARLRAEGERDEAREQRDTAQDAQRLAERKVAGAEAIATSARARADKMESDLAVLRARAQRLVERGADLRDCVDSDRPASVAWDEEIAKADAPAKEASDG